LVNIVPCQYRASLLLT